MLSILGLLLRPRSKRRIAPRRRNNEDPREAAKPREEDETVATRPDELRIGLA
jgi:hypothetical protein